jgi:glycerol-3-phosphate cytidylyltransferase
MSGSTSVVGYAPGAYDLFHVGHLNVLRQARRHCDVLVAGVVSDEMCELTKGVRPFVPLEERLEIVRSIDLVDAVHAETTPDKLDAWHGSAKGRALEERFAPLGVEVVYFPYTMHTSSTQLRRALTAAHQVQPHPVAVPAPA